MYKQRCACKSTKSRRHSSASFNAVIIQREHAASTHSLKQRSAVTYFSMSSDLLCKLVPAEKLQNYLLQHSDGRPKISENP